VIDQVTGATPPDCVRVAEYGVPALPFGRLVVVITGLDLMVSCRSTVSVALFASDTMAENENVPGAVGVPPITPSALSVRPAGKAPPDTDH
jgi:hypothetical protein